ncbi:hypothetical protein FSOLCH5_005111 [Fusarium solani]|jgi:hypothetical protein
MRLLNTEPVELKYFADNAPQYAILSHTWDEEEVTFQDMEQGRAKDKKGYTKVSSINPFFCSFQDSILTP